MITIIATSDAPAYVNTTIITKISETLLSSLMSHHPLPSPHTPPLLTISVLCAIGKINKLHVRVRVSVLCDDYLSPQS